MNIDVWLTKGADCRASSQQQSVVCRIVGNRSRILLIIINYRERQCGGVRRGRRMVINSLVVCFVDLVEQISTKSYVIANWVCMLMCVMLCQILMLVIREPTANTHTHKPVRSQNLIPRLNIHNPDNTHSSSYTLSPSTSLRRPKPQHIFEEIRRNFLFTHMYYVL